MPDKNESIDQPKSPHLQAPMRAPFGEISNDMSKMPMKTEFSNFMPHADNENYMGVQQPFYNSTKRRDKKLASKLDKLKKNAVSDQDKKVKCDKLAKKKEGDKGENKEKKATQNEGKKDKAKGRTQKNSDQKMVL